ISSRQMATPNCPASSHGITSILTLILNSTPKRRPPSVAPPEPGRRQWLWRTVFLANEATPLVARLLVH
ncbi:MAG: hypothetical protein WBQ55_20265, partial [Xanthobacteraceae bacterium]